MSIIKSLSVGEGDMFYIKHNTDNFTIIDCCLTDDNRKSITKEIKDIANSKGITRFISTHPDEDHIQQLDYLDDEIGIINFYCVKNEATKEVETSGFKRYCQLRDSTKAYHIYKGCSRRWMNEGDNERHASRINILWPITNNKDFKSALEDAKQGECPNNISPIIKYGLTDGATVIWMGDMETSFMKKIEDEVSLPKTHILFAPHHGRESGKVIDKWLKQMQPEIVVIGEALSEDLNYYTGYNTIKQNSAGDIVFECEEKNIHVYASNDKYSEDFLTNERKQNAHGCYYIGTLNL